MTSIKLKCLTEKRGCWNRKSSNKCKNLCTACEKKLKSENTGARLFSLIQYSGSLPQKAVCGCESVEAPALCGLLIDVLRGASAGQQRCLVCALMTDVSNGTFWSREMLLTSRTTSTTLLSTCYLVPLIHPSISSSFSYSCLFHLRSWHSTWLGGVCIV